MTRKQGIVLIIVIAGVFGIAAPIARCVQSTIQMSLSRNVSLSIVGDLPTRKGGADSFEGACWRSFGRFGFRRVPPDDSDIEVRIQRDPETERIDVEVAGHPNEVVRFQHSCRQGDLNDQDVMSLISRTTIELMNVRERLID